MATPKSTMEPATCVQAEPFALQVIDDSMVPEFEPGCVVIIDPTGRVIDGAFVLAELENEYTFRQLRLTEIEALLAPLNDDYPVVRINRDLAAIRGVIVQRAGRKRSDHKHYE